MTVGDLFGVHTAASITPRDYQEQAIVESFRQWDDGIVGTLDRIFTGGGKTICAALKFEQWMRRGESHRCMVISYEKQLVWQFAQELNDVLGIQPSIEMEKENISPIASPRLVVASRATLLPELLATDNQRIQLEQYGIVLNGRLCTKRKAATFLRALERETPPDLIEEQITLLNDDYRANHETKQFSRLHKFDWRDHWLVAWDEGHKHAYKLRSVKNIVDWFDRNPASRRFGLTATPKRFDQVSLGHKMFPGIAIDYPLYSVKSSCAVKDGWAVPYVQKYIEVHGVDFAELNRVAGDFDDSELERVLGEEGQLAKLVEPLLDMVEDRQTLVFSPGVQMARDVATYINARVPCECTCGRRKWYARQLVGDGAKCDECQEWITSENVLRDREEAKAIWGSITPAERKGIYVSHQEGRFQILSACSLCKEGYNDPGISCVAIFRPVSKAASALAEQMKGRGCRPLKGVVDGGKTKEQRLEAIANSDKPNCLIVDLCGVTGLPDCASTASIYAEGLDDEIIDRATELSIGGEEDMEVAVRQATEEIEAERQRIREEREERERRALEEAQKRAAAGATVDYTTHQRGVGANGRRDATMASEKQINYIGVLGLDLKDYSITKRQAGRIITQLKEGMPIDQVKYRNGLPGEIGAPRATLKQMKYLQWKRIPHDPATLTKAEASKLIDQNKNPHKYPRDQSMYDACKVLIDESMTHEQLSDVGRKIVNEKMSEHDRSLIVEYGRQRRAEIDDEF